MRIMTILMTMAMDKDLCIEEGEVKIAISSTGETLDSKVDPRFGRAPYFVVVETDETGEFQISSHANEAADVVSGAGTEAAQQVVRAGAKAVVTGAVGPHAFEIFEKLGMEVYWVQGDLTVEEAIRKYRKGELRKMTIKRL
jgi:predicted Fe-Mo cluster-binding NifX family protein